MRVSSDWKFYCISVLLFYIWPLPTLHWKSTFFQWSLAPHLSRTNKIYVRNIYYYPIGFQWISAKVEIRNTIPRTKIKRLKMASYLYIFHYRLSFRFIIAWIWKHKKRINWRYVWDLQAIATPYTDNPYSILID